MGHDLFSDESLKEQAAWAEAAELRKGKKEKQVTYSCHLLTVLYVIYFMLNLGSLLLTAVLFSVEFTSVFIFL